MAGHLRRSSTTSAPTESDSPFVYLDASAFVKLVLDEPESATLEAYLSARSKPTVSNALLRIEAIRAVWIGTGSSTAVAEIRDALDDVNLVSLDDATIRRAETIEPSALRTLDAIHLVTALHVGAREMIVYDRRLADAARAQGLTVTSPGA